MGESNYDNEEVFSKKVRAGKRTYFFDVKATKGDDYYVTITESKKRYEDGGYVKHKIFLYKEDFNKFSEVLEDFIKQIPNAYNCYDIGFENQLALIVDL